MGSIPIDDGELNTLLKQALSELLEEKNEIFYEAIAEVVEEVGLAKAIKEGEASPAVSKERVFKALERKS